MNDLQSSTTATAHRRSPAEPGPVVRLRFVVVCLILAVLALIPGGLGRLGFEGDSTTAAGRMLLGVRAALDDIRFGSGLRFWLGVGGATAMALLLLYPVRKALAGRRFLGSISAWFKLHLVIGLFAPVAILYHADFGHGGMNANVALWAMLTVAVSGLIGHFVYARASAAYWGDKQAARRNLDGALALITSLGALQVQRDGLAQRLDLFDAEQVQPRQGIRAALEARYAVAKRKKSLIQEAVWVVDQAATAQRLAAQLHHETRVQVAKLLHGYFAFAGRAANRSVGEQIWARWRLFHLPLFLVMCVATGLHVAAVWDMDGPAPSTPVITPVPVAPTTVPATAARTAASQPLPIQQVRRSTIAIDQTAVGEPPAKPARATPREEPRVAQAPVEPKAVVRTPQPAPKVVTPGAEAPPAVAVTRPPPRPPEPKDDAKPLYEELQKRSVDPNRMALGKPRSLDEQIATLKAKMKTREFKHAESETGFALTGKHTRADCTDCHTQPLKEERSESPRQCVACHKKDDVHKGRRPLCVDCHTTTSFRERKKKPAQ